MYKIITKGKLLIIFTLLLLIFFMGTSLYMVYAYTVSEEETTEIKLPIIMYHSILKSRRNEYIVSPTELEKDLKYLQQNNFNTITAEDLINYIYSDIALPEKPVMITFDDGYLNNITYAVPLLEQYNMRAVISVVGSFTDEESSAERHASYSYLNWNEINEIINSDTIEIQCHTYNLHKNSGGRKGVGKTRSESAEEYDKFLREDILKFKQVMEINTAYQTKAFIYPFGVYSEESEAVIKNMGFLASFSCREKLNIISKNPESLYLLGRFNRSGNISSENFFKKLLKNYEE